MKGKGKKKIELKSRPENVCELPSKAPEFCLADVNKCSTYLSGVKKDCKGVSFRNLVSLQNELEYMYFCMAKRQEQLKSEIANHETPAAKRNKRSRSSESTSKKCAKKSKKCKGNGKKASTPCKPKNKYVQPPPKSFECGVTDAQMDVPKQQKNDGPARFWTFIEPYCADITDEDIKSIEAWIKTHDEDIKYQNIPELGSHYAEKWQNEDMEEEINEGSKSVENQKGCVDSNSISSNKQRILKIGEMESEKIEKKTNRIQNNSLTQRLVSTFVQENLMIPLDVCLTESSKDEADLTLKQKSVNSKSNATAEDSLHKRLCKGLTEIGAMDIDDSESDESEDEILAELKRLQSALIPVCDRNLKQKKHLLALAKAEIRKQDVKKKLKEVDAKIMEIYREIYASRCDNKLPTKKYATQIKKAIAERQKILKELESMS